MATSTSSRWSWSLLLTLAMALDLVSFPAWSPLRAYLWMSGSWRNVPEEKKCFQVHCGRNPDYVGDVVDIPFVKVKTVPYRSPWHWWTLSPVCWRLVSCDSLNSRRPSKTISKENFPTGGAVLSKRGWRYLENKKQHFSINGFIRDSRLDVCLYVKICWILHGKI